MLKVRIMGYYIVLHVLLPIIIPNITNNDDVCLWQMGLPPGAVQNALKKEGKDPEIINMDPEKSYASQVKKEDTDPPIKEEYAKFFKVRGLLQ